MLKTKITAATRMMQARAIAAIAPFSLLCPQHRGLQNLSAPAACGASAARPGPDAIQEHTHPHARMAKKFMQHVGRSGDALTDFDFF
jgi:hypothetical protein